MMIDKALLDSVFEELRLREEPLTFIRRDHTPEEIAAFVTTCKATKKKAITDQCSSFCFGNAFVKRWVWTSDFKKLAQDHFGFADFDRQFTPVGKDGQLLATALGRYKLRSEAMGSAVSEISKAANRLASLIALYGATLTMDGTAMKISIPTTKKKAAQIHTITVDADGIKDISSDNGTELGREASKVHLES